MSKQNDPQWFIDRDLGYLVTGQEGVGVEISPNATPAEQLEASDKAAQMLADQAGGEAEEVEYHSMTKAQLIDEINSRNADIEDVDDYLPTKGNKDELIAALEADDEAQE